MAHRALLCVAALWLAACEASPPDPFPPLLRKHTGRGAPPLDSSNKYIGNPAVTALGKMFYFDPDFSGKVVFSDMLLQPMTTEGRAAPGAAVNASCNSCHEVARGGSDHTKYPSDIVVSLGGGAYDVNGQQTINSAYNELDYWNGRNDSLWSQIVAVVESHVSVNGSRMRTAWRIVDKYRAEYEAAFPEYPLPPALDSIAAQKARLNPDGSCKLDNGACPPSCHTTYGTCLPRFPLEARPGFVEFGDLAVCQWGQVAPDDVTQPYGDAWDCMQLADQRAATRIYVNFAKAIAAYEYTLVSRNSPFDVWAESDFAPGVLSPEAERGAELFVGKAGCAECHSGANFTDNRFHNIGVPQLGTYVPTTADCPEGGWCDCVSDDTEVPKNCLPFGARDGLRKLRASRFRRDSEWSDDANCRSHFVYHSMPNYAETHADECDGLVKYYSLPLDDMNDALIGAWKTPSLRDVALTAPYMHNGMYWTLREVIEQHYNTGAVHGRGGETIGKLDYRITTLTLSNQEIDDLVAFLNALTGEVDSSVIDPPVLPGPSAF